MELYCCFCILQLSICPSNISNITFLDIYSKVLFMIAI